jgi:hypothetical protein
MESMSPLDIANTQNEVAEKCIVHCNHALETYSVTYEPHKWQLLKYVISEAYARRSFADQWDEIYKINQHCRELVDGLEELPAYHFQLGLDFRNRKDKSKADPTACADKQVELADQCLKDCDVAKCGENAETAIGICETAMKVFTKELFPRKWADVQMILGSAYLQRVDGVVRQNMEKAERCFRAYNEVHPGEALIDDIKKKQYAKGAEARRVGGE